MAHPVGFLETGSRKNLRRFSNGRFSLQLNEVDMSKSNAFENALLLLLFNGDTIANVADNAASSPATTLTISLHTASPGEGGDMTTSEATYGSYARVTVARTSGGWTVAGSSVSPVTNIDFPAATSGSETITHCGIGTGVADNLLYYGTLDTSIAVVPGVAPRITNATTITEA